MKEMNEVAGQGNFSPSAVPYFQFEETLQKQQAQLKNNPLMLRFAQSRKQLKTDPHRPIYHFTSPESTMHDANGLCFWQGRWHLFYQAYPPEDRRVHWGHAFSDDLIHWRDLPYAIYPHPEESVYSGATLAEENRVIAMYHGLGVGNMVAVCDDPLLLNWEKIATPAIPTKSTFGEPLPYFVFDPSIWKKDGIYYSLMGGGRNNTGPTGKPIRSSPLFRSADLIDWRYLHEFVEDDRFTLIGDDAACPYFWPIGDRHILLFFSHMSGTQYLLGDYDKKRDKFNVTSHGRFNFNTHLPGGVHAPSATPDGAGGVNVIFNMNSGKPMSGWNELMTLPRRLTLSETDQLRVEPAGAVESLRGQHAQISAKPLPANREIVLPEIEGNAIELIAEIDTQNAAMVELNVLRSPDKEEYTSIKFFRDRGYMLKRQNPELTGRESLVTIETAYSSILPDALSRAPETAPVRLASGENLQLRVFIDKSVVEVFINGKQCLAVRAYPGKADSVGVSLRAQGQDALLVGLDVWQMKDIY